MLATRIAATGTSVTSWSAGRQARAQHGALVLAEQPLDALERDRVDVPGVAGDVGDLLDAAVVRRVEAVVHAGRQPQRHVAAVAVEARPARDRAAGPRACRGSPWPGSRCVPSIAPDAPTMASHGLTSTAGSGSIGRAPGLSSRMKQSCRLANSRLGGLVEVEVGEQPPDARSTGRARAGCSILLNQPMKLRDQPARNAVGQQEVEVLLLRDAARAADLRGRHRGHRDGGCHERSTMTDWLLTGGGAALLLAAAAS